VEVQHRRGGLESVPAFPQVLAPWNPRQRYLTTYAEAEALFRSLPRHRAEWFWLCLWTAQHASDVDRMTWADVSPMGAPPWMLLKNSKNRKTVGLRVRMPRPLAEVLRVMFRRERPSPSDCLVRPWPSRSHTLPRHCRKLGLPELNAIDLRHTALSWAVRLRGITPAVVAFAGHSSPVMMARTYAHALPLQLEEVTADLESIADERPARKGVRPDRR
jgi:integrase